MTAGLAAFAAFSKKSPKCHDGYIERWEHFHDHPPTRFTWRTLFWMADQCAPGWDDEPKPTLKLDIWDACDLLGSGLPPPRGWLYSRQLCRGFLSSLVAPGDAGKTTLRLMQAIELATGRELLGHRIYQRCTCWLYPLKTTVTKFGGCWPPACITTSTAASLKDGCFVTTVSGPQAGRT